MYIGILDEENGNRYCAMDENMENIRLSLEYQSDERVGSSEIKFYEIGERLNIKVIPQQIIKA